VIASSKDKSLGGDMKKYTDINVLTCAAKSEDHATGKILSEVIIQLANSERIGRVTPCIAEASSNLNAISVSGKTIIAVDPGHPEAADARRIETLLGDVPGLPPIEQRYVPASTPSPLTLEILICPS